jgi:hypothetical protein
VVTSRFRESKIAVWRQNMLSRSTFRRETAIFTAAPDLDQGSSTWGRQYAPSQY